MTTHLTIEYDTPGGGTFAWTIDYDDVLIAHQVAALLRTKLPRVTVVKEPKTAAPVGSGEASE